MKEKQKRARTLRRERFTRETRERMRKSFVFQATIFSMAMKQLGYAILFALSRHEPFHKKIKELERRDVELHATPEELFFSKEERRSMRYDVK